MVPALYWSIVERKGVALYLEYSREEGSGASTVPGVYQRGREWHCTWSIAERKGVALYLEYSREEGSGASTVPGI